MRELTVIYNFIKQIVRYYSIINNLTFVHTKKVRNKSCKALKKDSHSKGNLYNKISLIHTEYVCNKGFLASYNH